MMDEQKREIIALRHSGVEDGMIETELGISINTIKSSCWRHNLMASTDDTVCEPCGRLGLQNPQRKRKRFCSNNKRLLMMSN